MNGRKPDEQAYSLIQDKYIQKIDETYKRLNLYIEEVGKVTTKIDNIESELFTGDNKLGKEGRFLVIEKQMDKVLEMMNKMDSYIESNEKLNKRVDDLEDGERLSVSEAEFVRSMYNAVKSWRMIVFVSASFSAAIYGIIQLVEWVIKTL